MWNAPNKEAVTEFWPLGVTLTEDVLAGPPTRCSAFAHRQGRSRLELTSPIAGVSTGMPFLITLQPSSLLPLHSAAAAGKLYPAAMPL